MEFTEIVGDLKGELHELVKNIRDGKNVSVFGMDFAGRTAVSALFGPGTVYVASDFSEAREAFVQLSSINPRTVYLPALPDVLAFSRISGGSSRTERLLGAYAVALGKADIVVTTAAAIAQLFPTRESLLRRAVTVEKGGEYDLSSIAAALIAGGYERAEFAESEGQFALRGDVLDVWPQGFENAVRTEFFGDSAESVRVISEDMTSKEELCGFTAPPASAFSVSGREAEELIVRLKSYKPPRGTDERFYAVTGELIAELSAAEEREIASDRLDFLAPLLPHTGFFGFVRPKVVVYDDCKKVYDTVSSVYTEHASRFYQLFERGEVPPFGEALLTPREKAFDCGCVSAAFHLITTQNRIFQPEAVLSFTSVPLPDYSRDFETLVRDVSAWAGNYRVCVCCGGGETEKQIAKLFSENGVPYGPDFKSGVCLMPGGLYKGAVFHDQKLAVIGYGNLTRKCAEGKRTLRRKGKEAFTLPEVGDYVVHEAHGIGLCEKVERMEIAGAARDYIVVAYAGGDKLYVPVENMDSLSKFVASAPPKLSKIGGAEFARAVERARKSAKALAFDLTEIFKARIEKSGYKYPEESPLMDEFVADFPYEETPDQLQAADEAISDLTSGRIMDRLLCGDVGYGKTEVALRVAFKVIAEGKQAAFISPTTILARQHFETVKRRMERFGVRAVRLTRFDSPAEIRTSLAALKEGKADIVCGTHRVLSSDVVFKDLGLVILDEEQRFGVADKEKLKTVRTSVNVLSMSATPIPRTLHMSLSGIRDISVLDTPPKERIPVETFVTELTDSLIKDAAERELSRGGQVFIVYNRVALIDAFAARVHAVLPGARVTVAHGQMDEGVLERAIDTFISGASDVLISSTIIENGIDMPRANTMIVADADRLGLSQLYQLRGRVGRSNRLAYVYFTFENGKLLTETAYKRLEAITRYTGFGSGFKLAMADLEIRGAGSVFGREQHGHMEKVGYDMYVRLIGEAVAELKGETASRKSGEVRVLTDYDAFIPDGLIGSEEWRLKLYSDVSRISTPAERAEVLSGIKDICGSVPDSVANLLTVALVKNLAASAGAKKAVLRRRESALIFGRIKDAPEGLLALAGKRNDASLKLTEGRIDFLTASGMINFLTDYAKAAAK